MYKRDRMLNKNVVKFIAMAIKERNVIAIKYRGQDEVRVVEPHVLYRNERGEIALDGYQVRGFSASGRPPPFWRPYRLKKITAINVLPDQFTARLSEGFSLEKKRYKKELLAAVDTTQTMNFKYPLEELQKMGPPKPEVFRKYF